MEALFSRLLVYLALREMHVACFTRRQATLSAQMVFSWQALHRKQDTVMPRTLARQLLVKISRVLALQQAGPQFLSAMLCNFSQFCRLRDFSSVESCVFPATASHGTRFDLPDLGAANEQHTDLHTACRHRHSMNLPMSSALRCSGHTTAKNARE